MFFQISGIMQFLTFSVRPCGTPEREAKILSSYTILKPQHLWVISRISRRLSLSSLSEFANRVTRFWQHTRFCNRVTWKMHSFSANQRRVIFSCVLLRLWLTTWCTESRSKILLTLILVEKNGLKIFFLFLSDPAFSDRSIHGEVIKTGRWDLKKRAFNRGEYYSGKEIRDF